MSAKALPPPKGSKPNPPGTKKKEEDQTAAATWMVVVGGAAIAFSAASIQRTLNELKKIEMMWAKGTTIKQLEEMA